MVYVFDLLCVKSAERDFVFFCWVVFCKIERDPSIYNHIFSQDSSAVMAAIEGRGEEKKTSSRTLARLAQQLDEDLWEFERTD